MDWALVGNILLITVLGGFGVAGILAVLIWKKNLATRVTYIRLVIQAVAFVAMFFFFTFTVPLLYVLITIFAVTIVFGRFFCGWLCPFGLVMDLTIIVRKVTKIRYRILPDRLNKILHKSRYVILLFFLFVPIALWLISPPPSMTVAAMETPLLAGPFRPYSILVDPLIPFIVPWTNAAIPVSQINLTYPYVQEILTYLGQNIGLAAAIAFVGITLTGSFFIRRVWCRFCPTGVSLAVVNRFKGFKWAPMLYLDKDEEKCTKCGVCKRVCQSQVTDVYEQKGGKINTSMCMLCLRCTEMCPYEDTLKLKFVGKTVFKSRNWLETSISE